jgi:hypothetical protein
MLVDIQAEKSLFNSEVQERFTRIQRELKKALNIYDNIAPSEYKNKKEYERAVDLSLKRIELWEMELSHFLLVEKEKQGG